MPVQCCWWAGDIGHNVSATHSAAAISVWSVKSLKGIFIKVSWRRVGPISGTKYISRICCLRGWLNHKLPGLCQADTWVCDHPHGHLALGLCLSLCRWLGRHLEETRGQPGCWEPCCFPCSAGLLSHFRPCHGWALSHSPSFQRLQAEDELSHHLPFGLVVGVTWFPVGGYLGQGEAVTPLPSCLPNSYFSPRHSMMGHWTCASETPRE